MLCCSVCSYSAAASFATQFSLRESFRARLQQLFVHWSALGLPRADKIRAWPKTQKNAASLTQTSEQLSLGRQRVLTGARRDFLESKNPF